MLASLLSVSTVAVAGVLLVIPHAFSTVRVLVFNQNSLLLLYMLCMHFHTKHKPFIATSTFVAMQFPHFYNIKYARRPFWAPINCI